VGDAADEFTTPIDLGRRRDASPESLALSDGAVALADLASHFGESARTIDGVTGHERASALAALERKLALAADLLHQYRNVISKL
jgi:hypothetical protein